MSQRAEILVLSRHRERAHQWAQYLDGARARLWQSGTDITPDASIDVIVTERGIAINPRRSDLLEATRDSGLPIKSIEELKAEADRICGLPAAPELEDRVVAAIKWVDGTVIDVVRQVSPSS